MMRTSRQGTSRSKLRHVTTEIPRLWDYTKQKNKTMRMCSCFWGRSVSLASFNSPNMKRKRLSVHFQFSFTLGCVFSFFQLNAPAIVITIRNAFLKVDNMFLILKDLRWKAFIPAWMHHLFHWHHIKQLLSFATYYVYKIYKEKYRVTAWAYSIG